MPKSTYNHMYTIAFEIGGSTDPDGDDITPQQIHDALILRAKEALANGEMLEAVGGPDNTYAEESAPTHSSSQRP